MNKLIAIKYLFDIKKKINGSLYAYRSSYNIIRYVDV